ncbi:hypothetical protein OA345_01475 [Flavobacteriales bacterium]|nr:hypothetical protein [Flavobacteriales bacterium]
MVSILFFISCIEENKVLLERPYLKKEIQIEENFDPVNFEYYLDTTWVDMIDSLSLEDYLRNTSKNPIAYYDRANFIFQQSKFNLNTDISILDKSEIIILEKIKNDLLKSIDLVDTIAEAQFLLSKVLYIQNEFEKSLTYSNNSIELYPNDNNYKHFRCMVWKSNGRQDLSYNFYRAKLDDVIVNIDTLIKPMVVQVKNDKTNLIEKDTLNHCSELKSAFINLLNFSTASQIEKICFEYDSIYTVHNLERIYSNKMFDKYCK